MANEQEKTLDALKIAIEIERDGRECYLQASRTSTNEPGKKLLLALADEEDAHRLKIEEIYQSLRERKTWPTSNLPADQSGTLRVLLAQTCETLGPDVKPIDTEVDILKMAIDKEGQSFDFYRGKSQTATYDSEREFYRVLAIQENEHHLMLLDYYELLMDPASWFLRKERQSLDGG